MFAVWDTREIRRYFQVYEEHPMEIGGPDVLLVVALNRYLSGDHLVVQTPLSSIHACTPTHIKTVLMHGYTCICVHMSYMYMCTHVLHFCLLIYNTAY